MTTTAPRLCSEAECDKPVLARGWCRMHYYRWYRGEPLVGNPRPGKARCSVDGCGRDVHGNGLCSRHYQQIKDRGEIHEDFAPFEERFWARVDRSGGPTACWPWLASLTKNGYGQVSRDRKMQRVHRVAYELTFGPIPDGDEIDHVKDRGCVLRHCANPAHLEAVSHLVNSQRSSAGSLAGRRSRGRTHCPSGHLYDEANTAISPKGWRACRTCNREKAARRRWKARRKT